MPSAIPSFIFFNSQVISSLPLFILLFLLLSPCQHLHTHLSRLHPADNQFTLAIYHQSISFSGANSFLSNFGQIEPSDSPLYDLIYYPPKRFYILLQMSALLTLQSSFGLLFDSHIILLITLFILLYSCKSLSLFSRQETPLSLSHLPNY